ncbi:MAG: glycerophosphodiester phosphodiesterase [Desulfuromonadales bacterium]
MGGILFNFLVWAHRGASSQAPENTMAAFLAAEAAGASGIELDVHLSRDGVAVVIHDETLERTTNGQGPVSRRTYQEIRALDAGSWFGPAFRGEGVPSLEEVMAWAGGRLRLNIEIKAAEAGLAVLDLQERYPDVNVLLSSFNHRLLAKIHRMDPELALGYLVEVPLWHLALKRAVRHQAASFHPRVDRVSRAMVTACRRQGMDIVPWTVDDLEQLDALRRQGVQGVFTNDPQKIIQHLARGRRR